MNEFVTVVLLCVANLEINTNLFMCNNYSIQQEMEDVASKNQPQDKHTM